MNGQIVIGEGELDEAPMLYIGEKLGTGNGPSLDIAVDPLKVQILQQIIYLEPYRLLQLLKNLIYLMHQKHIWIKLLLLTKKKELLI